MTGFAPAKGKEFALPAVVLLMHYIRNAAPANTDSLRQERY